MKSAVAEKTKAAVPVRKIKRTPFELIEPYLYIAPAMILFSIWVFFPFGKTLVLSTTTTDPKGAVSAFAGLGNYISILTSSDFLHSLWVTVCYAFMTVVLSLCVGFVAAILANEKIPGIGIFRTIYALPMAVASASAAIIFMFIYHPSIGMLNYLMNSDIGWLTDPKWALFSVVVVKVWMSMGLNFIFILAALQSVPAELYEAASIEGAGFFRKHWNVTIPCISPTLFFLLIMDVINSFQSFAEVNLMTRGGPGNATNLIVYQIYLEAFFNNRFGMACAQSVILFVLILCMTLIQFRLEKKVTY